MANVTARARLSQLLRDQHLPFGHGGNYWRDHLRLEQWESSLQPVVYMEEVYNGYKLLRRLGDYVWLTKDHKSKSLLECSLRQASLIILATAIWH
jgi:hypothetical protein